MLLLLALLLGGCDRPPEPPPDAVIPDQGGVTPALNDYLREHSLAEDNSFEVAYVELNRDAPAEALVLMQGLDWCSIGGCTLLVFRGLPGGYFEFLSRTDHVREPIVVSDQYTQGWRDLVVGTQVRDRPEDVILEFATSGYPPTAIAGQVLRGLATVKGEPVF